MEGQHPYDQPVSLFSEPNEVTLLPGPHRLLAMHPGLELREQIRNQVVLRMPHKGEKEEAPTDSAKRQHLTFKVPVR